MEKRDLRRYIPVAVILLLVIGPLAIWGATSGGSDKGSKEGLIAERGVGFTGAPEIVLSINGNAQVTTGKDTVGVKCTDKDGNVIIDTRQPWPFIEEPGYQYPHVHLADDPEKIEGARNCRVSGTDKRLEADVQ